jgi:hypothetical protein
MATSLQINLAPTDLPHLIHILPHQIRQLGGQVDEILLTLDLHQSPGRYGTAWKERLPGFLDFVQQQSAIHPKIRIHEVDYSRNAVTTISELFFGGELVPLKDRNGAPFYAYFSGFASARYDYIFHIDSDMMFGGGSQFWIAEAKRLMEARPEVMVCVPHPGPPTPDGTLRSQTLTPEPYTSVAFRASHIDTRVTFFDRRRLISHLAPLPLLQPPILRRWQARLEGNFPYMYAEASLSFAMRRAGFLRIDFLGQGPGLWSLHPPYRNSAFYERLPLLIQKIEQGDVPDGQLGDYDINDSMVDWSSVRKSVWRRKLGHVRLIYSQMKGGSSGRPTGDACHGRDVVKDMVKGR